MRWPTARQKEITFRRVGYEPFPLQALVHRSQADLLQVVGAEGGGKSRVAASEVLACVPWCKLVYLVGQSYTNTHPEFDYLVEGLLGLGALRMKDVSRPKHGSWQLTTLTGCRVVTLSVDRGASAIIALGEEPDIIVLTEAGIISSYSVLMAAIRRVTRVRGRVILVGTLKDNFGWYASLVDELQSPANAWRGETMSLPAWCNTRLYPGGRNDPEIKRLERIMPPDEFKRTVAAERVASRALIFAEFSYANHVRECVFDPDLPVHLWVDPGYYPSKYAVVVVQFHGDEVWQVDEVYENFKTHQEIIELSQERAWWSNVERVVMDIAGRQHNANAKKSGVEVWSTLVGLRPHSQPVGVLDGIARHRTFLSPVARLFHDPSCVGTLSEYKRYKRPTDSDGNPTHDMPVDEHNHAMKAIAYGLVDRFGFVDYAGDIEAVVIPRQDIIEEIDAGEW